MCPQGNKIEGKNQMRKLVMESVFKKKINLDVFQLFKENGSKTLCMVEVAAVHCLYSHKTFNSLVK